MRKIISLLFAVILIAFIVNVQAVPYYINLKIYRDGYVLARIFIYTSNISEINFTIPKDVENIIVTDENSLPLNYSLDHGEISIVCPETKLVKIIFVTSSLTKKEGNIWYFRFYYTYYNVSIIIPSDAVVLNTDPLPLKVTTSDNNIVLYFSKSPISIEYTLLPPKNNVWKNNESNTDVTNNKTNSDLSNGSDKNINGEEGSPWSKVPLIYIVAGIVSVIFFVIILLYMLRRRGSNAMLTVEERDIVNFIKSRRGKAYLTEITEGLGLPKTTVWRKIRKLEKLGYVKTEKRKEGLLVIIR